MSNQWNQWEGQIVAGKFPLLRYLGGSEPSALFATQIRENDRLSDAAIKLVPATPESGEMQLARWQESSELSHPNLIPLFDSGWAELGNAQYVFLVMELAEENLAQVLPARALDAAEARQMLESVAKVLYYLHSNGFVHGSIKPANILATGDQLKVSNDSLYRAGEALGEHGASGAYAAPENARERSAKPEPLSPASDVWSLGVTLVETLTQKAPLTPTENQRDPSIPRTLPEPFLEIAQQCLVRDPQRRWSIAQISDRLQGRAPVGPIRATAPEIRDHVSAPEPQVPAALPTRAPRPIVQHSRVKTQKNKYAIPFAIGFAVVLGAIVITPKLFRRPAQTPDGPEVAEERHSAPAAPSQPKPSAQKPPAASANGNVAEGRPAAKGPVAVPALAHPEAARAEATDTVARSAVDAPAHGGVAHRAMPEVLQSATRSIRGAIRVNVKVNVDRAGNVEDAELASRGPSKYFARAALQAAQQWKFNPPQVGGRGVLSSWILQFEFTRDGTNVVPTQELP